MSIKPLSKKLILSVAVGALLPAIASAATAYLQNAKVLGTGTAVRIYRVPTTDVNGTVRYRDVTVNLPVTSTGAFGVPTLTQVLSPNVQSNQFVTGTYRSPNGYTCVVSSSIMDGGRSQYSMNCTITSQPTYYAQFTWYSGPITGSPLQAELTTAQINLVPGNANFGWGELTGEYSNFDSCFYYDGQIVGFSMSGTNLVLTNYGNDNITDCGITLRR